MGIKKIISIMILIIIGFLFRTIIKLNGNSFNFDDSKIIMSSRLVNKFNQFSYKNELNKINDNYGFFQVGLTITKENIIIPAGFLNEKLPFVVVGRVIGTDAIPILVLILIICTIVQIALTLRTQDIKLHLGMIIGGTIMLSPLFSSNYVLMFSQIFVLYLVSLSGFLILTKRYKIGAFFLGILSGVNIIYGTLLPFFIIHWILNNNLRKSYFNIGAIGILFLLGLSPTLFFNLVYYGNPVNSFYTVGHYINEINNVNLIKGKQGFLEKIVNYFLFNPKWFENFKVNFGTTIQAYQQYGIMGIIGFIALIKHKYKKILILGFFLYFFINMGFDNFFGYGDPKNLLSSLNRYFIIITYALFLFGGKMILRQNIFIKYIIVGCTLMMSINTIYSNSVYPFSLYGPSASVDADYKQRLLQSNLIIDQIVKNKHKTILVSEYNDQGQLGLEYNILNVSITKISIENYILLINKFISSGYNVCIFSYTKSKYSNYYDKFQYNFFQNIPFNYGPYYLKCIN